MAGPWGWGQRHNQEGLVQEDVELQEVVEDVLIQEVIDEEQVKLNVRLKLGLVRIVRLIGVDLLQELHCRP